MKTTYFELQFKFLFIMNVVLGFLKIEDFASMIILHTLHILFLHFKTMYCMSPNLDEVSVCFKFFGYYLLLMIFIVSNMFSILSLFLSWSRFFDISVNSSGLFLFYVEIYAKDCSLLWGFFLGGVYIYISGMKYSCIQCTY